VTDRGKLAFHLNLLALVTSQRGGILHQPGLAVFSGQLFPSWLTLPRRWMPWVPWTYHDHCSDRKLFRAAVVEPKEKKGPVFSSRILLYWTGA